MARFAPIPLALVFLVGCASPARSAALMEEGDFLRRQGENALTGGSPAVAAEAFARSFGRYLECQGMARSLLADRGGRSSGLLRTIDSDASEALSETAILAAEAHCEIAIAKWRRGDRKFDQRDYWEALVGYQEARESYAKERRWLAEARRRLDALAGSDGEFAGLEERRASIESDLEQLSRDLGALDQNVRLTLTRIDQEGLVQSDIGREILHGLLVGAETCEAVLEHVGLVLLRIMVEPAFWEICFRILACCARR